MASGKRMKNRRIGKILLANGKAVHHLRVSWSSPVAGELHVRTWACPFREPVPDKLLGGCCGLPGAVDAVVVPRKWSLQDLETRAPTLEVPGQVHLSIT